jgi:hypothetical protein
LPRFSPASYSRRARLDLNGTAHSQEDHAMSGGIQFSARRRCARPLASGLLAGLLITPWSAGLSELRAEEASAAADQASVADQEEAAAPPASASDNSPRRKPGVETSRVAANRRLAPGANDDEKSIVVELGAVAPDDADVAVATDEAGDDALEPIATASEYEPELADPPVGEAAAEPTLADDYVAVAEEGASPAALGAEDEPVADDVCVDEPVSANGGVTPGEMRAATFNGATPGVTTRAEVRRLWGDPLVDTTSGKTLAYELENFPSVTVSFAGDIVRAIRVELPEPADSERLIAKLGLAALRPAVAVDATGAPTSTTFPERGVTLNHRPVTSETMATDSEPDDLPFEPTADRVYEIVIGRIEASAFALRAEASSPRAYGGRMADLETALRLDGVSAHVRFLLSQTKLAVGEAGVAEQLASQAVELEPRNDDYRLQRAKCLKYLARYNEAVDETRLVLEGVTATQLQRAQALEQMALLAALGSREVQERAIPLHNKAIALADKLSADENPATRIAATQLLVGAHLAVAERIAAGNWQAKDEYVAQWLTRASALAEQMIAAGEADVSLRLQVAVSALAAGAQLNPPIDPQLWIAEAEQAVADLQSDAEDAQARAEIDWQLGLAYYYATETAHRRAEADKALKYGAMAEATLSPIAESRSELPDTAYVLGRLRFQVGAVHAVLRQDHATACQWYDRAVEPLSQPVPVTSMAMPGQHGDALVSMAVSYWENGDRERAYDLTQAGVELVQQGVDEGLLAAESLEVPRNNLLSMSRALGKVALTTPSDEPVQRQQTAQAHRTPTNRTATRGTAARTQVRTATRRSSASSDIRRR